MKRSIFIPSMILFVFSIAITFLSPSKSYADVSNEMYFQSILLDHDGTTASDGQYTVTFSIWDGEKETDNKLWEEQHVVSVKNGVYNVSLGSIVSFFDPDQDGDSADALSFAIPYYLGVQHQGNDYMKVNGNFPGLRSVGRSFRARTAGGQMIKKTNSSYTITENEDILLVSGSNVITLPSAKNCQGRILTIKNVDSDNSISVHTVQSETIDQINCDPSNSGKAHFITDQSDEITIISDGQNWISLGIKKRDLSKFYEKSELDQLFSEKANADDVAFKSDVYTRTYIDSQLQIKADLDGVYSKAYIDSQFAKKPDSNIVAYESNIYTRSYIDSQLSLKANQNEVYTKGFIDDQFKLKADQKDVYSKAYIDSELAQKVDSNVAAFESDIYTRNYLDSQLTLKANQNDVYPKEYIDSQLTQKADSILVSFKSDSYTRNYIDSQLSLKANQNDVYSKIHIDFRLEQKADSTDVALKSDVYSQSHIDSQLLLKANQNDVYTKEFINSQLEMKADVADIAILSDVYSRTYINLQLENKANKSDIYSQNYINSQLSLKANQESVYTKSYIDTQLAQKADSNIVALESEIYTQNYIDSQFSLKANQEDVYTKVFMNSQLALKANIADVAFHTDVYSRTYIDLKLDQKANQSDIYTQNYIDYQLSLKANQNNTYTRVYIDSQLQLKADQDDMYSKVYIDSKLALKADSTDVAFMSEIYTQNYIDTQLSLKADQENVYTRDFINAQLQLKVNQDDNYPKEYIDAQLAKKADANIVAYGSDVYTRNFIDSQLLLKANLDDMFSKEYINSQFALKADTTDVAYKSEVYSKNFLDLQLSLKANQDETYSKEYIDSQLGQKANSSDVAFKSDVQSQLSLKADQDAIYSKVYIDIQLAQKADSAIVAIESEIYTRNYIDSQLSLKANQEDIYSKEYIDSQLEQKSNSTDVAFMSDVYSQSDIDSRLLLKANQEDVYSRVYIDAQLQQKVNQDDMYSQEYINSLIAQKVDAIDFAYKSEIYTRNDLDSQLSIKANKDDVYTRAFIDDQLSQKADSSDVAFDVEVYNRTYIDSQLSFKANQNDVYTKEFINSQLAMKADVSDIAILSDVYSRTYINLQLDQKANKNDIYSQNDIDSKLFLKANQESVYTKAYIDNQLSRKADSTVVALESEIYTRSYIDSQLSQKANQEYVYTKVFMNAQLAQKANAADVALQAEVYSRTYIDLQLDQKANQNDIYTQNVIDSNLSLKANQDSVYTRAYIDDQLSQKADSSDVAFESEIYTRNYIDSQFSQKANQEDVYTKVFMNTQFALKANAADVAFHTDVYSRTYIDLQLDQKANQSDIYTQNYIESQLLFKANQDNVYTRAFIDDQLSQKADSSDVAFESDIYTRNYIDSQLLLKANQENVYTRDYIDAQLQQKVNQDDMYSQDYINSLIAQNIDSSDLAYQSEIYTRNYLESQLSIKANQESIYTRNYIDSQLQLKADQDDVYSKAYIDTQLSQKSDSTVVALEAEIYTRNYIDSQFSQKANLADVYTKVFMNSQLALKANAADVAFHTDVYSRTYIDLQFDQKANQKDIYTQNYINSQLSLKANQDNVYTRVYIDDQLAQKADSSDVAFASDVYTRNYIDTQLSLKPNQENVYTRAFLESQLLLKADQDDVYSKAYIDTQLSQKSDSTVVALESEIYTRNYIDSQFSQKANQADVYTKVFMNSQLALKADAADVAFKSDVYTRNYLDFHLDLKSNQSDIYTRTHLDSQLSQKANLSFVETQLNNKLSANIGVDHTNKVLITDETGNITIAEGASGKVLMTDESGNAIWENIHSQIQSFIVNNEQTVQAGDIVQFVDGFVQKGITKDNNTIEWNSSVYFNDEDSITNLSVASLSADKFVIVYTNGSTSYGSAIIGQLSGQEILWGNKLIFNEESTEYIYVSSLTSDVIIVVYQSGGKNVAGKAIVGLINDKDISWGTPYDYHASGSHYNHSIAISENEFVVLYKDLDDNKGKARVGQISGTDISWGTESIFNTDSTYKISGCRLNSTSFIIAYDDRSKSDHGSAMIGNVSNLEINWGSEHVFNNYQTTHFSAKSLNENSIIIAYMDNYNYDYYGKAIIGNVTGTSIAWETPLLFNEDYTQFISLIKINENRVLIAYTDEGKSEIGTAIIGDISNNSISWKGESVFHFNETQFICTSALNATDFIIVYQDNNTDYGATVLGNFPIPYPTIGISIENGSPGDTIKVALSGIAKNLTGLTAGYSYYSDECGNLTASVTDRYIGLAISETELLIQSTTPGDPNNQNGVIKPTQLSGNIGNGETGDALISDGNGGFLWNDLSFDGYTKTYLDDAFDDKADLSDVYNRSYLDNQLQGKANTVDVYSKSYLDAVFDETASIYDVYTRDYLDSNFQEKADFTDIYTRTYLDNIIIEKANISDVYTRAFLNSEFQIKANNSDVYTKTYLDSAFQQKANMSDIYTKTYLNNIHQAKANISEVYSKTYLDNAFLEKANVIDVYTKTYLDNEFQEKANAVDVYTKTYLDNAFQEKANISNVYSKSQINQSIFTENLAVANAGIFTGTVEIKENLVLSSDSFSLSNTTIKTIASTPQTITFPNSSGIIQLKGSIGEFSGIKLNGTPISVTADQINQLTGVNRPVQEQIDEMQSKNVGIENANQILMSDSHGHITASTGLSNQVLTIDEYGKPFWNDIDTVNGNLFVDGMLTVQGSPSTFSHISSESIAVTSFISTNDLLVQGSIIFAKNSNPLSQTTLTSMNQTAPRSITLPDASGIVVLTTDSSGKITTNNIKDNAITSDQISNGSISTEDIADHSITPEKLSHSFSSIYTDTSLSQSHQGVLFISGNTIITLPDASENMGKQLTLKKVDSSENFIKVSGIVDGETNPKIRYQFDYMTILSDGSNWYKIAEHMTPDITPPLPGNEGIITFNNITANSVDISWEYGVDNETSQVDLEYLICVSLNMDDMLSVPSCEYQKHVDYTKNLQSKRIDNLSHQSMHYINVIVKDNSQNKSFYKEISVKTLPFFEVDNRNNLEGVRYTSIAIADYDNDQDLDILMAGSSISKNRILMLYNNDGTGVFSKVEDFSIPSISHYDIEWLDLNNNSYLDLIITGLDTHSNLMTYFYINQKNNEFSEINNNSIVFRAIDQGDYDNDGDMDIISLGGVNNESPILYNNNGGQFTKVSNVFNLNISYGEFEWADINNDGCLDLFFMYESMMMMEFNYKFFFQTKTAQFIENTSNTFLNRASEFFDFADYDNDSDLDLLVNIYDESWNSHLKLFPNNGSGVFSEADSITLTAINPSASSWGDFDNDGFSDLIIIGKSKNNNSSTFLYRNVGNGVFTELSDVELIGIHQGTVCFGDFDNDKDLDIIISGRTDDGQLETKIYTNNSKNNTIPSTPTDLTSNVFGSVTLSWSASSDSETISPGLSYHVLINKNAGEPSSISFDNGYRKIVKEGSTRKLELTTRLPYGTYFWTVQAIDTAYAGSPFAPEQSFSIVSPSPGDSGKITPVDITTNSVQLKWMTASNDTTPYSDLMYMVYVSTVDYGYQVNNWINDGEPINSWETNISTQKIENLTQDTEYFCTVLVKDADGDINIYNAVSVIPRLFTEQKDIVLTALMESSSIWADYDADQDLDIIIYGKTFEYEYTTTIYNNLGANNFAVLTNSSLAGLKYGDFSMADFDKDEDLDFINTGDNSSSTVTMLYKNNTTNFNVLNDVYIQGAKYSDIVWADLNNDGNLDLIVTGYLSSRKIATQIFQYIGNNQFIEIMDHNVMGVQNGAIEVADLNNDGLLDILIAGYSDSGRIIKIYQNHKGFTFNEVSASNFDPVYYCSIHCGDYNNDGFLDILLTGDNSSQSIMKIYQNTKNMEFVELSEINLSGIKEGNASWGDYDNDGYLDILLMGRDNNYKPITKIYKNNQNNTFEELNDIHFEAMYEGEISWGDYDNDNDIDILATGYNRVNDKYSSKVYRNNTKTINTRPSSPTELTSVINDGTSVTFEWNLGTDAETPEKGLSYNLCVGSGPDVCDIVSPMSARTGFQYIPARGSYQALSVTMDVPGGKYYWGVQSVDTSFVGSPLTLSNTFNTEVPSPGNSGYITIDFVHKDSVTLSWENAIDDATAYSMLSYKVCYSTNDYGQTVENWENNTSSSEWMTGITNHKITDLTSGTNYYFNVIVKDESNYKSTYLPTSAIPSLFTDMTSIELKGLASAAIEWGDYSNDGYLDLILLGMYQPGSQTYGAMFRNCKNDNFFLDRTAHSAQGATVNWVDCDNDGDLDLFYSGYDSSYNKISRLIIIDDNGGRVTSYSSKFIPVRVATSSWGDFDNDGDLDLIISGMGSGIQIALYENLGNLNFREVTDLGIIGTHSGSIEWGDFDNDADLDLILTGFNYDLDPERITKIYQNNGNKTFSEVLTNNFPGVENGSGTWGDYNNDGYLDILLTGTTYKNSNYTYITKIYKNLGNKTFTEVPGLNITGIAYGSAKWGDVDNDGDLDILIRGSIGSNYYVAIYENNGEDIFTQMSNTNLHQFSGCRNSAKWGDFDNNGSLDFIIAGSDGTATYQTKIYRNNAEILNTVPSAPQNLTVNFIDSKVIFSWTSSTDIETPSNGLSYNLRIGSEPGACDIVTPMALSTGFRIIAQRGPIQGLTAVYTIPSGIYYWTVQAVDTAFAGSPFAIEQTFTIP